VRRVDENWRLNRQAGCLPCDNAHFLSIGVETGNEAGGDGKSSIFIGEFEDYVEVDGNEFLAAKGRRDHKEVL
jgi:hypothetical protein